MLECLVVEAFFPAVVLSSSAQGLLRDLFREARLESIHHRMVEVSLEVEKVLLERRESVIRLRAAAQLIEELLLLLHQRLYWYVVVSRLQIATGPCPGSNGVSLVCIVSEPAQPF